MSWLWWQKLKQKLGMGVLQAAVELDQKTQQRLTDATPVVPSEQLLSSAPTMIFDLETTGLNTRTDTVLSIGAVKLLPNKGIDLGNSFYQVLDIAVDLAGESQLIHGLTQKDLAAGCAPRQALLDFLTYSKGHIWLAFHAEFDRRMIKNAALQHLGLIVDPQPIDIAYMAPLLFPELSKPQIGLDYWLNVFELPTLGRHNATADALATAELLMILLHKAQEMGYETWGELGQACLQQRQLQRLL